MQKLNRWTFEAQIMQNDWCTPATAVVYSYMLSRFTWFKTNKLEYFDSQEQIAAATAISASTVKRSIQILCENKYLDSIAVKHGRFLNNKYVVIDVHGTYSNLPRLKVVQ